MIDYVVKRLKQPIYSIFLIITDGEIHDMAETKRLLVEASTLPLSVIIIGVGEDRFVGMQELDCDGTMLRDLSGKVA